MPDPLQSLPRRALLRAILCQAAPPAAAAAPPPPGQRSLVVIFLRGGADGLGMVVPHFDPSYEGLRPFLKLSPEDTGVLDGRFGLHPALAPLAPLYASNRLGIVHAVGSDDETRSHFEAQDLMEHGGRHADGVAGGWVARHLRVMGAGADTPLGAVALSSTLPESLRGSPAVALGSLREVTLSPDSPNADQLLAALAAMYGSSQGDVASTGEATLAMIQRLADLEHRQPATGGDDQQPVERYPDGDFGTALADAATLIHAGVGLKAACIDLGGWDTHFVQGATTGLQAGRMRILAEGLAAFCADLGPRLDDTLVVVQTEFGRRVYENASLGTDHGRASVMFALGANVRGGRILGEWPGLTGDDLEGPGDLAVTTDYRDVLAELLSASLGNDQLSKVFPGYTPTFRGLV